MVIHPVLTAGAAGWGKTLANKFLWDAEEALDHRKIVAGRFLTLVAGALNSMLAAVSFCKGSCISADEMKSQHLFLVPF